MDWTLIPKIAFAILGLALIVGAVPAFLIWNLYYRKSNRSSAKELSDGRVEFPPSQWTLMIWPLLVVYSAYRVIMRLEHRHASQADLISIAILGFAFLEHLISFPGTVAVTRDGLEQIYWFRKTKYVRWSEIVEINTGDKIARIEITGTDGTKIIHSKNLADRARLMLEIKQHCGDNLPPEFPIEGIQP